MAYQHDMEQVAVEWAWCIEHGDAVVNFVHEHPHRIDAIASHLCGAGLLTLEQMRDEKVQAALMAVFAYGMIAQRDGWPEKELPNDRST